MVGLDLSRDLETTVTLRSVLEQRVLDAVDTFRDEVRREFVRIDSGNITLEQNQGEIDRIRNLVTLRVNEVRRHLSALRADNPESLEE